MFKIKVDEAVSKDLIEKVNNAPRLFSKALNVGLTRIGNKMRNGSGGLAPYKTGNLRRSITVTPRNPVLQVKVGSNLKYARIQDLGGMAGRNRTAKIKGNRYLTSQYDKMKQGEAVRIIREEIEAKFK